MTAARFVNLALIGFAAGLALTVIFMRVVAPAFAAELHVSATVLPPPIRIPGGVVIEGELAACEVNVVSNLIEVTC